MYTCIPHLCLHRSSGTGTNVVELMADEVAQGRLAACPGGVRPDDRIDLCGRPAGWTVGTEGCALPAGELPTYRAALLTAVAARHLLPPGVVTAAVIGSRVAVHLQLAVIARYVPGVSHVSVRISDAVSVDSWLVDALDLAGIGLSVARDPGEAAFGANLVVIADLGEDDSTGMRLSTGAVLVNATGRDLPAAVLERVSRVFVDDLALVERAAHTGITRPRHATDHPRPHYRLAGDLRGIVAGRQHGRTSGEDVLLVELLSASEPAGVEPYR